MSMIGIDAYRCCIGLFNLQCRSRLISGELYLFTFILPSILTLKWIIPNILAQCNDIESNPGPRNERSNSFNFCSVNIRSLMAQTEVEGVLKIDELSSLLDVQKFDVLGVTETWLDDSITNDQLAIPGYLPPLRRDRNRQGGGVAVYISEHIVSKRRTDLEPDEHEIVCVELKFANTPVLISVCYRPQTTDTIDFMESIDSIRERAGDVYSMIFTGDFNGKHQSWCDTDRTCTNGRIMKRYFDSHNFDQLIHEPTRFGTNDVSPSCLDLIFTNIAYLFKSVSVFPQLSKCDHCPVSGILQIVCDKPKCYSRHVWYYDKGDYIKFRALLRNARWDSVFAKDSVSDMCTEFMSVFHLIASECVPNGMCIIRPKDKPWMNSDIRKEMRKRDRLYRRVKMGHVETLADYKRSRNKVVSLIRKSKVEQEQHIVDSLSTERSSSKTWWQSLRRLQGCKQQTPIPPLIVNGQICTDAKQKADVFNNYFVSQSSLDQSRVWHPGQPPPSPFTISDLNITEHDVFKIVSSLDLGKATGPDGIGNKLLREAAPCISGVLARLFQLSIDKGCFPDSWKIAQVVPLHKKDELTNPNNYRPVSLLPCISKVFEKLVFNHVHQYLRDNNLITEKQSGFSPGDSTINQLINVCHNIYSAFDNGDEVIGVFLDFSKAFDTVWHEGLLFKLERVGIKGKLLSWFKSYLTGRKQRVVINSEISDVKSLESGVPQGSVLGPLLFLVYINDIVDNIQSDCYLFADDTSLFETVKKDIHRATNVVNQDLSKINQWCRKWLIKINATKTKSMLFSRKRQPTVPLPLYLNNELVANVVVHKHLGIVLSKSLDWHDHIIYICSKASSRIRAWKSVQYKLSRKHMENCINLFVYPLLDYGDILYDNCKQSDKNELRDVHLAAGRAILGAKTHTSHEYLYKELGWQPLQQRRDIHKTCKMYDIVQGHTPAYLRRNLPRRFEGRGTRSTAAEHFVLYYCKTEFFRNSFYPTGVKLYNSLDTESKSTLSRNSFKVKMKRTLKLPVPPQYYTGPRKYNIVMCQMRLRFCDLNFDLYSKGCVDSPLCPCGNGVENLQHYFFECDRFATQRLDLIAVLGNLLVAHSAEILICGSNDLSEETNTSLHNAAIHFIVNTERFG